MIGIKLRKSPAMCITVSMESAEFCPNPYRCTHSLAIQFRHYAMYTHIPKRCFIKSTLSSCNRKQHGKSCDLDGKHRKNVHFYRFRVCPNPICRRRAERTQNVSGSPGTEAEHEAHVGCLWAFRA